MVNTDDMIILFVAYTCYFPLFVFRSAACACSQLSSLVAFLQTCKEFGFDLEAHNARTYHGLTCLLQISTVDKVRLSCWRAWDMSTRGVLYSCVVDFSDKDQLVQWRQTRAWH